MLLSNCETEYNTYYACNQMARLSSISLFALLIAHFFISGVVLCTTITLVNKCNKKVWPAIVSSSGSGIDPGENTAYVLKKDETKSINLDSSWSGLFWGRTQCARDESGNFTCLTGDCGSGKPECDDGTPLNGLTFAEFWINSSADGFDSFVVNVVSGFNLPIMVVPQGGTGPNCSTTSCNADLETVCPSIQMVNTTSDGVVACDSSCRYNYDSQHCCLDPNNTPDKCKPTSYSNLFKAACPMAWTFTEGDNFTQRSCAGADYNIIFCPTSQDARATAPARAPAPAPAPNTEAGEPQNTKAPNTEAGEPQNTKPVRNGYTMALGPKIGVGGSAAVASILFLSLLYICYRRYRKHNSSKDVEDFIRRYGPSVPKKFKYSTLKKITNSFKEELGKGGYGNVYKGKLPDGCVVAVKVLIGTKGNGEDFINEVASIGRTCHVNIVSLLGFVYEGKKRALIYEFMPNGSLEKFIHGTSPPLKGQFLSWEKLYSIALGIARGLEYLHCGCATQILHFDIKPHNILLDEDFCPKISDFGLAKLYSRKASVSSSTMRGRGTPGYIAPEVGSRNYGPMSHKSDVYSYGMMILEMVGGRKNVDTKVARTSEIYFPRWVYKHIHVDEEISYAANITEEENHIVRKMMIVGLWCIQTDPSQRPSISKVIEMLEGNLASLEIPPKPYLCSPPTSPSNSQPKILSKSSSRSDTNSSADLVPKSNK